MEIYINNQQAALKQGTSFEYISENRLFTGSDSYTLTITFPLRGCPQNQAIFGNINRADVAAQKLIFDCEIRDKGFYKFGCITITEINQSEVKVQFLEGRSELNFDKTFDKVYINELDLGQPTTTAPSVVTPSDAWKGIQFGMNFVALPWVNDGSGNIQNCATFVPEVCDGQGHLVSNSRYDWHTDTRGLSWQPYLIYITKKICEAVGYSYDFSAWEAKEEYKFLLICNTLPYAWYTPQFARALPHWTVEEYFEKLELFMAGEFDINHRTKHISFGFSEDILEAKAPVEIVNVIEEHSTEVKVEEERCDYIEAKNLAYKDCDHEMWKFYSCEWFIKSWSNYSSSVVRYNSLRELLTANQWLATWNGSNMRGSNMNKLLYAADLDAYFIIRTVSRVQNGYQADGKTKRWIYKCVLQPVNPLGPRIVDDSEDADATEIEFVPAWIDYTDDTYGWMLFLKFSGYDEETSTYSGRSKYEPFSNEWYNERNNYFAQTQPAQSLAAGEADKKAEYYDRIYIGWWDGAGDGSGKMPYPKVVDVVINDDWSNFYHPHFSLRINNQLTNQYRRVYPIEPTQKTTFKFLSSTIPDVRSLFYIQGKKYICEKLTSTFTEHGMSRLIKGVFYPVKG